MLSNSSSRRQFIISGVSAGLCLPLYAQQFSLRDTGFVGLISGSSPDVYWESSSGVTGSPASAWQALAGGFSLAQASAGLRPAVTASAFGVTTGLTFDGVDDVMTYSGRVISRTGAASLSLVFKTAATVSGPQVLISQSDSAVANDWWEIGITSTGKIYIESNAAGTKQTVYGSTVLKASTVYNVILAYDGIDFYLMLNGAEENPLTIQSVGSFAWLGRVAGTTVFSAGATVTSGTTARYFTGVLGGIYFWNHDITA